MQNLVKHLPEQEQLNTLAKYKSEYSNLSEPEQFGVVVSIFSHMITPPDTQRLSAQHQVSAYRFINRHKYHFYFCLLGWRMQ